MAWHTDLIDKMITRDRTATIADYLRLTRGLNAGPWVVKEQSWPEKRDPDFFPLPRIRRSELTTTNPQKGGQRTLTN